MVYLSAQTWDALCLHAQETFPEECCGAVLIRDNEENVRRVPNIQNAMHAKDPQRYPRDATIAYLWDPKVYEEIMTEVESGRAALKAFYHSHPNHDAYFSAEDKAAAMPWGEPSYPETAHLVISIYNQQVRVIRAYGWDEGKKDFVEIELSTEV
jgi:proteasome lid subunit RPN8/RPN11